MAREPIIISVTEEGIRVVKRDLESLGTSAAKSGNQVDLLKQALVALGAVTALKQAIGTISRFDEQLARLRITTAASSTQLAGLADAARQFGVSSGLGATESARALEELTRSGLTAQEAVAGLAATNALAQGSFAQTDAAARAVGLTMRGFGTSADQAADVLAEAARRSRVGVDDLGQSFRRVGPIANSLGISLEQVAAVNELLADSGIRGAASGVALADAFRQLEAPSQASRRALAEIGVSADALRPSAVGLAGALQTLATAGLDAESATRIFGGSAGLVLGILAQQSDALGTLEQKYRASAGSARAFSQVVEATLPEAFRQVRAALEELALNADIVGPIRASLKIIEELINQTSRSIGNGNLGLTSVVVNAAISLDAVRAAIAGSLASASILFDNFGQATSRVFTAVANFGIRTLNDFLLAVQRALNSTIETINSFSASLSFGKLGTNLAAVALPQISELRAAGTEAGTNLGGAVGEAFNEEFKKRTFATLAEQALAPVQQGNLSPSTSFGDAAPQSEKLRKDVEQIDTIGQGLKDAFLQADLTVRQLGKTIGEELIGALDGASAALARFTITGLRNVEDLRAAVGKVLEDLATQILSTLLKALLLKAITSAIGGAEGSLGGTLVTALGGTQGGRADGGPVIGGVPVVVGERGRPELFVPSQSGTVLTQEQAASLGVGRAAAPPQVNVEVRPNIVNVSDPNEVTAAMNSAEGERTILNVLHRNRSSLKALVQ